MNPKKQVYVCSNSLAVGIVNKEGKKEVQTRPGGLGIGVRSTFEGESNYELADWKGVAAYPQKETSEGKKEPDYNLAEENNRLLATQNNSYLYLKPEIRDSFYKDTVNGVSWPFVHDMPERIDLKASFDTYDKVNRMMANAIYDKIQQDCESKGTKIEDTMVWIHDSHLASTASHLKNLNSNIKVGYFHHTPFEESLRVQKNKSSTQRDGIQKEQFKIESELTFVWFDLLKADSISFHTQRDLNNFVKTIEASGIERDENWKDKLKVNPIGIPKEDVQRKLKSSLDVLKEPNEEFKSKIEHFRTNVVANAAENEKELLEQVAERLSNGKGILHDLQTLEFGKYFDPKKVHIGSIQRSDYTKGVHPQLMAYHEVLKDMKRVGIERPQDLVQLNMVCSSARDIPAFAEYENKSREIEADINKKFPGAVNYITGIANEKLPAFNAMNDISTATSVKDGYILAIGEAIEARNMALSEGVLPTYNQPSGTIISREAGIAVDLGGEDRTSNLNSMSLVKPTVEGIKDALKKQIDCIKEMRQETSNLSRDNNKSEFSKISSKMTDIKSYGKNCLDHLASKKTNTFLGLTRSSIERSNPSSRKGKDITKNVRSKSLPRQVKLK